MLPFIGWLLARRPSLSSRQRLLLVVTSGLAYLGLVVILTWQALRGQSVIAPDPATLAAFGILLSVIAVVVSTVALPVWIGRGSHSAPVTA